MDIQNEQQNLKLNNLDIPFTQDKLRILRLTQSFDVTMDYASRFYSSLTASFGIDGLGARKGSVDLPMSKDGAKPDFQKLELTMNYSQGLADGKVQLSLADWHKRHSITSCLFRAGLYGRFKLDLRFRLGHDKWR
ncbi:MAG: hypothetical protein ACR5LC_09745 [Symbiopectobacterium sp.]